MRHQCFQQARRSVCLRPSSARPFTSSPFLHRVFQEGDVVLLREKKNASHDGKLIKLSSLKTTGSHRGVIKHADIIGKESRQIVLSNKGSPYRVHEPTLAEYVRLTPRLVTPIYPSDTNLIVSLLDIHVDTRHGLRTEPPLEILEAGTGHGALTLHLSRAIHAANPPRPRTPSYASIQEDEPEDAIYLGESISELDYAAAESWKQSRSAIIHTLDISSKHSKHAKTIVEGFRHGIYAGNIDYHVGDVSAWIADQTTARKTGEPFLTHVFLDLPSADSHLANVAPALHVNGMLAVFNPSITQIADCVEKIREDKMPYLLDQVIELGAGTIREWDVRAVRPRATLKKADVPEPPETPAEEEINPIKGQEDRDVELPEDSAEEKETWAIVCRPKAGQQVVGGGFLGLWRRMERATSKELGEEK